MRVVVSGVPGVGKTTILDRVFRLHDIGHVNFGDIMQSLCKRDRDEMRRLPRNEYIELQQRAAERIARMENVIIDTHISVARPEGYYPGLPMSVLEKLKPRAIILIEKDPVAIAEQASKDKTRKRETNPKKIKAHQEYNRWLASAYSAIAGCSVKIIQVPSEESYPFEGADIAAREIANVLKVLQ